MTNLSEWVANWLVLRPYDWLITHLQRSCFWSRKKKTTDSPPPFWWLERTVSPSYIHQAAILPLVTRHDVIFFFSFYTYVTRAIMQFRSVLAVFFLIKWLTSCSRSPDAKCSRNTVLWREPTCRQQQDSQWRVWRIQYGGVPTSGGLNCFIRSALQLYLHRASDARVPVIYAAYANLHKDMTVIFCPVGADKDINCRCFKYNTGMNFSSGLCSTKCSFSFTHVIIKNLADARHSGMC